MLLLGQEVGEIPLTGKKRRKGLVSGCAAIPRVFHSHGMKTGNGVVGTGQAVVGGKGNALARVGALTRALL